MAQPQGNVSLARIREILPEDHGQQLAHDLGLIEKKRKLRVHLLVWTLVLGFELGSERTLQGLRHLVHPRRVAPGPRLIAREARIAARSRPQSASAAGDPAASHSWGSNRSRPSRSTSAA